MRRTPQSLRLEPLEDRALPSYGLDPTFSGDGLLQAHMGNRAAVSTAVQPDGRILVQESTDDGLLVARFNPDGTPDDTFGTDGRFALPGVLDYPASLAVGGDALIYTAVTDPPTAADALHLRVLRLTADGRPDDAFADGGFLTLPIISGGGAALAVQPDGKVVAVGTVLSVKYGLAFGVARFLPSGEPDPSFAGDGLLAYADPTGW